MWVEGGDVEMWSVGERWGVEEGEMEMEMEMWSRDRGRGHGTRDEEEVEAGEGLMEGAEVEGAKMDGWWGWWGWGSGVMGA